MAKKEHDLSKLPKWAAGEIDTLRRRLARREEEDRKASIGDTEVFIETVGATGQLERKGLPPRSQVSFIVAGEQIDVHVTNEGLRVGGYNKMIAVYPRAANVIIVRPIK